MDMVDVVDNLAVIISVSTASIDQCIKRVFSMDQKNVVTHLEAVQTLSRERGSPKILSTLSQEACSFKPQGYIRVWDEKS